MATASISPDQILKELTGLWRELGENTGHEGAESSGSETHDGVLRACTMTLMTFTEERDDVTALGQTLASLMPQHPARTIVVRLAGPKDHSLSERVYAQCWMPFGQRRQICCEQIEITASDEALGSLPPVLLPLAVADLPRVLWCRSPRLLFAPEFTPLRAMADKLILDSAEIRSQWMFGGLTIDSSARTALHELSRIASNGVMLGDLAWTRLTRWREAVAQVFESRDARAGLASLKEVVVVTGGEPDVAAFYLGAWVMDSLGRAGLAPHFHIERGGGSPLALRLSGDGFQAGIEAGGGRLVTTVNGLSNCSSMPEAGEYELMSEELSVMRRDRALEATLPSAVRLASATWK